MKKKDKKEHKVLKKNRIKFKRPLILLSVFIGLLLLGIFILNFPYARLRTQKTVPVTENSYPVSSLQFEPKQNMKVVLDQPIQSTGCNRDLSIKPGTTSNIEIQNGNTKRSYLVHLPPSYSNTNPHALILSFHGYDSNDLVQERISKLNQISNNKDVIVVYPQGTTGILAARGWNTGHHPTLTANDVLFVSNLLNNLQSNLCINPKQIYATGFSNGGGFVGELACKLSNRIAAFAPISGSYVTAFSACTTTRPVSILEFHGTADKINPYGGMTTLNEFSTQFWLSAWAKKVGCSPKPSITKESNNITKYVWSSCRDNASIIHYKIVNGSHVWPRGQFKLAANGIQQDVNTASIIWNFFQQHPLQ